MTQEEATEFITALRAVAGTKFAQELAEIESAYRNQFGESLPPSPTFEDSILAALREPREAARVPVTIEGFPDFWKATVS